MRRRPTSGDDSLFSEENQDVGMHAHQVADGVTADLSVCSIEMQRQAEECSSPEFTNLTKVTLSLEDSSCEDQCRGQKRPFVCVGRSPTVSGHISGSHTGLTMEFDAISVMNASKQKYSMMEEMDLEVMPPGERSLPVSHILSTNSLALSSSYYSDNSTNEGNSGHKSYMRTDIVDENMENYSPQINVPQSVTADSLMKQRLQLLDRNVVDNRCKCQREVLSSCDSCICGETYKVDSKKVKLHFSNMIDEPTQMCGILQRSTPKKTAALGFNGFQNGGSGITKSCHMVMSSDGCNCDSFRISPSSSQVNPTGQSGIRCDSFKVPQSPSQLSPTGQSGSGGGSFKVPLSTSHLSPTCQPGQGAQSAFPDRTNVSDSASDTDFNPNVIIGKDSQVNKSAKCMDDVTIKSFGERVEDQESGDVSLSHDQSIEFQNSPGLQMLHDQSGDWQSSHDQSIEFQKSHDQSHDQSLDQEGSHDQPIESKRSPGLLNPHKQSAIVYMSHDQLSKLQRSHDQSIGQESGSITYSPQLNINGTISTDLSQSDMSVNSDHMTTACSLESADSKRDIQRPVPRNKLLKKVIHYASMPSSMSSHDSSEPICPATPVSSKTFRVCDYYTSIQL